MGWRAVDRAGLLDGDWVSVHGVGRRWANIPAACLLAAMDRRQSNYSNNVFVSNQQQKMVIHITW